MNTDNGSVQQYPVSCNVPQIEQTGRMVGPNGKVWKVQKHGTNVDSSLGEIKGTMEGVTQDREYNLIQHNCHLAQERTREQLGLEVEHPYHLHK